MPGGQAGTKEFTSTWTPALVELLASNLSSSPPSWPEERDGLGNLQRTLAWLDSLQAESPSVLEVDADLKKVWRQARTLISELAKFLNQAVDLRAKAASAAAAAAASEGASVSGLSVEIERQFRDLLHDWVDKLQRLPEGRTMLFPATWPMEGQGHRPGQQQQLHVAILVIARSSYDKGVLTVVNMSGVGSQFHPQRLNGVPARPHLGSVPVQVQDASWDLLCNTCTWVVLLRPLLQLPGEDQHQLLESLYHSILPFFAGGTHAEQRCSQLDAVEVREEQQAVVGDTQQRQPRLASWTPLPISDNTLIHACLQALTCALELSPEHGDDANWAVLLLQWDALYRALGDASARGATTVSPALVGEACRKLARRAAAIGCGPDEQVSSGIAKPRAKILEDLHSWLEEQLSDATAFEAAHQQAPQGPKSWKAPALSLGHHGFDHVSDRSEKTSHAGPPERPDVVLPIPLVRLPASVASYREAIDGVRHCLHSCALLANQRRLVPNSALHTIALVQNLFFRVLPVPLPRASWDHCFWRQCTPQQESQAVLVRDIGQVLRLFVMAVLSQPPSLHLQGVLILTLAAGLAILDAVIRRVPEGVASDFSRLYSGFLGSGVEAAPFGLAPLPLAEETKELVVADSRAAQLRTMLLDYFASVGGASLPEDRALFSFKDMRLGPGDWQLLHRLALLRGLARGPTPDRARLLRSFTGQIPDLQTLSPEFMTFRDLAFLTRVFCVKPLTDVYAERRGELTQANVESELRWDFAGEELRPSAFRMRGLTVERTAPDANKASQGGFFGSMKTAFFGETKKANASTSMANASTLAGLSIPGLSLESEDDVLHAAELPTFNGRLSPIESEQLFTFLTVPYIRVPLVLRFFNSRERFTALANPDLQAMLDAVLFAPGQFKAESAESMAPEAVPVSSPSMTDSMLGSPAGRLVHELITSPSPILQELDGIFRIAVERDSPTFSSVASAVLYALRLWARVLIVAQDIVRCSTAEDWHRQPRGFRDASRPVAEELRKEAQKWRLRLLKEAAPTVERWCQRAMDAGENQVASAMWLHLALLHTASPELSMQSASTLLGAQIFVNTNTNFTANLDDTSAARARAEQLGFSDTEIFEIFHSTRVALYKWLLRDSESCGRVLDHVFALIGPQSRAQALEGTKRAARRWVELDSSFDGDGRFALSKPTAPDPSLVETDFARWLTEAADAAIVEVNVNLGHLQFRQHAVTPVPKDVQAMPEFQEIALNLDDGTSTESLAWAMVERAPERERYRLFGLGYECRLWMPDQHKPEVPFDRSFPTMAFPEEEWVAPVLDAVVELHSLWRNARWFAPSACQEGHFIQLAALVHDPNRAWTSGKSSPDLTAGADVRPRSRSEPRRHGAESGYALKFIEVFREPATPEAKPVVHVYDAIEHCRQILRMQVFTSHSSWSKCLPASVSSSSNSGMGIRRDRMTMAGGAPMMQPEPSGRDWLLSGALARGQPELTYPPARSLEVAHETPHGEALLIPSRFLSGSLPDCLLEAYEFWSLQACRLVGRLRNGSRRRAASPTALVVKLENGKAEVQRVHLAVQGPSEETHVVEALLTAVPEDVTGCTKDSEMLVDLLHAQRQSPVWEVARWALQLDDLSHVLAWSRERSSSNKENKWRSIDLVEFPRVGISFRSSRSEDGSKDGPDGDLGCDQHGGLKVLNESVKEASLLEVLRPLTRATLLRDTHGELFALVSVADRPCSKRHQVGVALVRNDDAWLSQLRPDQRHCLFHVHASRQFLTTTTLIAELYLMLLRILQGMWFEASAAVIACMGSGVPHDAGEALLWNAIVEALRRDCSANAAVLRLKLSLELHHHACLPPDAWNLPRDLATWVKRGNDAAVGHLLTPAEEVELLSLCEGEDIWELDARRDLYSKLLRLQMLEGRCVCLEPAPRGSLAVIPRATRQPPASPPVLDTVDDKRFLAVELKTYLCIWPEEIEIPENGGLGSGVGGISWLLQHLPPRLPRDFLTLYELLSGAKKVWLFNGDSPGGLGPLLARLIPSSDLLGKPTQAGILQAMLLHPELAEKFPKFQGDKPSPKEDFAEELAKFLHDHLELLRIGPESAMKKREDAIASKSRWDVWAFRMNEKGLWQKVSLKHGAAESKAYDAESQSGNHRNDLELEPASYTSLSNSKLLELRLQLAQLGDRRLPSTVWDMDCRRRIVSDAPDSSAVTEKMSMSAASATLKQRMNGSLPIDELPVLASRPLMKLGLSNNITWNPLARSSARDAPVLTSMAPDQWVAGQTKAGRLLAQRLRDDTMHLAEMFSEPIFLNISLQMRLLEDRQGIDKLLEEVNRVMNGLTAMLHEDRKQLLEAIKHAVALANSVGSDSKTASRHGDAEGHVSSTPVGEAQRRPVAVQRLGQLGGSSAVVTFHDLMKLLLVDQGIEMILPHINPLIQSHEVGDAASVSALAMMLSARTVICSRCRVRLERLSDILVEARLICRDPKKPEEKSSGWLRGIFGAGHGQGQASNEQEKALAPPSEIEISIAEASQRAAEELAAENHTTDGAAYDPLLLSFQFMSRLTLRGKQVSLVHSMRKAVEKGEPLVHQMLMGQGKTTVVTPLMVLLLATADRACVVCTPTPLLEFTKGVLIERLCAALTRPVLVFDFARTTPVTAELHLRLLRARSSRAAICAGPSSMKALILRFLLTLHGMDTARTQEKERTEKAKQQDIFTTIKVLWTRQAAASHQAAQDKMEALRVEAGIMSKSLKLFQSGVVLLDDIDLLMHPLRSELHWPLGEQRVLDFTQPMGTQGPAAVLDHRVEGSGSGSFAMSPVAGSAAGTRWQVVFHLLDAIMSSQLKPGPAVSTFGSLGLPDDLRDKVDATLARVRRAIAAGLAEKHFQATPHLTLLSQDFYHQKLKPCLAEWALLWLQRWRPVTVPDATVLAYLRGEVLQDGLLKELADHQMKALNLLRMWLTTLLPFVISRVHRVHYGLLHEGCDTWEAENRARRQLAVPFVGKDVPSEASEFSHPDVVVGFTWLSYRLDGLRPADFTKAVESLVKLHKSEIDIPPNARRGSFLYSAWAVAAGARVRGSSGIELLTEEEESETKQQLSALALQTGARSAEAILASQSAAAAVLPPLEWLDVRDASQMALLSSALRNSPFLIEYYLHEKVFPELLQHPDSKLSASGQDLGGEMLCGSRLGFSGTPNDLLPRALGQCVYAKGDSARMLHTLTDSSVVEVLPLEEKWDARSILKVVARARPPLNALIDVGALITGFSNFEVAKTLLEEGLAQEAVVFCDLGGEQRLYQRGRVEAVRLSHCALPAERRFVFYDQVHTTGIDINHSPAAQAALTIGKDSTFRDFAQGAYRMRGIGRGQRLRVLLTPEIHARMHAEMAEPQQPRQSPSARSSPGEAPQDSQPLDGGHGGAGTSSTTTTATAAEMPNVSVLDRLNAWLLLRQSVAEDMQQRILNKQAVTHEGRRCAFGLLQKEGELYSLADTEAERADMALDLFRERVDYTIDTQTYGTISSFATPMRKIIERMKVFLDDKGQRNVDELSDSRADNQGDGLGHKEQELGAEQEQEQEQEEEEEQEEEREQEEEIAKSWQQNPPVPTARREETPEPWSLEKLGIPPVPGNDCPFYPLAGYEIPTQGQRSELSVPFPEQIWVSKNFHRPGRGRVFRRLRTAVTILEWTPDGNALQAGWEPSSTGSSATTDKGVQYGKHTPEYVKVAMQMLGLMDGRRTTMSARDLRKLLGALGTDVNDSEAARLERVVQNALQAAAEMDTSPDREQTWPSPEAVLDVLHRAAALRMQPARYYVLLTLAEAEAVRAALHFRSKDEPFLPRYPGCRVALRALDADPPCLGMLDSSPGWEESESPFAWHSLAVGHCLRFLNAEMQYKAKDVKMLRTLLSDGKAMTAANSNAIRDFFLSSYTARRLPQPPSWQDMPIATLFSGEEEFVRLQRQKVLTETRERLLDAGVQPSEALQHLDQAGQREISAADLGPSSRIGLVLPASILLQLFDAMGGMKRGVITREEWLIAFDDDLGLQLGAARDRTYPKLSEPLPPPDKVPLDVLQKVVLEVTPHTTFSSVWNSEGTMSREHASIWAPTQLATATAFSQRVKALRVAIGHYANQGFADARGGGCNGVGQRQIVQVRDRRGFPMGSSYEDYLALIANHYFPHPINFRQVWCQQRGKSLFIWRPVPPSDAFVVVGMLATTGPDPPPLDEVRCVPRRFCRPASTPPVRVWDDSGSGGQPASIWVVNAMQVLWMAVGHSSPDTAFWDMVEDPISFDANGQPSVDTVGVVSEASADAASASATPRPQAEATAEQAEAAQAAAAAEATASANIDHWHCPLAEWTHMVSDE